MESVWHRAGRLRAEFQRRDSPSLRRRRWIAGLSAIGLADSGLVALHQMGALPLPDLPGRAFDSNAVTTSRPAYVFGVPDAALAAVAFSVSLVAASAGASRRAGRSRWWDRLLALNAAGVAAGALGYLADMLLVERRLCPYCLTSFAVSVACLPLALRELWAK